MPLGRRQLFIYWRVAGSDLPAALTALREWQCGLIEQHPGLHCGLYQRRGSIEVEATVMESYAIESDEPHPGIDQSLCRHIDQAGQVQLKHWLRGARHVEEFDALPL